MAGMVLVSSGCRGGAGGGGGGGEKRAKGEDQQQQQLSLITFLLAALRKSVITCRINRQEDVISAVQKMEIGWPTDVRHVTHVTFDRSNGFVGLPVEFELGASASLFGVSPELLQCSYDSKGNIVPTILLIMQEKLYLQGGLKAEGIFRINPENSQEEKVKEQLNKGIISDDIDIHCLAGLIKAWFRELPAGILDSLSPEQVLQCNSENQCVELVKLLLPTQAALLNWVVELMADVVEEEEVNKMNARNIAMVFAPNMTQTSDPLTALMHAVQVMNLLKTLVLKTLREREEEAMGEYWPFSSSPTYDESFESQQVTDISGELEDQNSDDGAICDLGKIITTDDGAICDLGKIIATDDDHQNCCQTRGEDYSVKEVEEDWLSRQQESKKENRNHEGKCITPKMVFADKVQEVKRKEERVPRGDSS